MAREDKGWADAVRARPKTVSRLKMEVKTIFFMAAVAKEWAVMSNKSQLDDKI